MTDPDQTIDSIQLSETTKALIESRHIPPRKESPLVGEEFKVSETVSFFGFAYERIRNAIEFQEEHLIRRMAIRRILNRRFMLNPSGKDEGQNVARELLWGRYVPAQSLSQEDLQTFQQIIDAYVLFLTHIKETHTITNSGALQDTILDLMACEIEEELSKEQTAKRAAELYFFYQTLVRKIDIKDSSDELTNAYFYVATEKALGKNDRTSIMYHLFLLRYDALHRQSSEQIKTIATQFHTFLADSQTILDNPYDDKLTKFALKQTAPFRILYELLERHHDNAESLLTQPEALEKALEEICNDKYAQTRTRLRNAATRSITYIFLTKMIFVLLLEIPLTHLLYDELELFPIAVNTLLPPMIMGVIVSAISSPSSSNTQRIFKRIVDIINENDSFETHKTVITQGTVSKRPVLLLAFSLLYLIIFMLVFIALYVFLDLIGFNMVSKSIFVFFLTVVTFFAYRIRQTSKEYVLEMENNVLISSVTFMFLPILYVGKILSNQVSKINLFIIFFDYLIEAPYKFIIDIFDEWTRFIKARKEDIV